MSMLSIKDLPINEELDRRAMSAVRGGMRSLFPILNASLIRFDTSITQFTQQSQTTFATDGSGMAGGRNSRLNVEPHQDSSNIANLNLDALGRE
jgi:hypothetical protein